MTAVEAKRIDGRYIVAPLVVLILITAVVFLSIQLSGRGAKETNYLLLSYTAALRDIEEGYYSDAVKNLTPVIDSGSRPQAYGWRGEAYLRMKEYAAAENDFRSALEYEPALPANHAGLGAALAAQNKSQEALSELDRAIELFERPDVVPHGPVRRTGDELSSVRALRESVLKSSK